MHRYKKKHIQHWLHKHTQELVNTGGIKTTDNKEEVMACLLAHLPNVDLATRVRAGEVDLNVTQNTTSLDASPRRG